MSQSPNKFHYSGPKITEADIVAFEQRHKVAFPPDYRAFMLEQNGGSPENGTFRSQCGINTVIAKFYPIEAPPPYNLENMAKTLMLPKAYKEGILVIGSDVGGSKILLAMRGEKSGTVYFLNREVTLRPKGSLHIFASSFAELLQGLLS